MSLPNTTPLSAKNKIITIPIKPHLKKFILKCYRSKEPIVLREDDKIIGSAVMSILIDKRQKHPIYNFNDLYSDTLKIKLSDPMSKRSPSIKKLVHLNDEIDDLFKQSLYIWVHACTQCGVNPYNATRGFVEYYNFDEKEYTHDAAQRAWLRYRNSEYSRKKKAEQRHKKSAIVS